MNKKIVLLGVISFIIIAAFMINFVLGNKKNNTEEEDFEIYTVPSYEKVFLNGVVTHKISKKIYLDDTKGIVSKVLVKNKDNVKKDDILFYYHNDEVQKEIEELNDSIESNNNQKDLLNSKLQTLNKQIEDKNKLKTQESSIASSAQSITENKSLENSNSYSYILEIESEIKAIKENLRNNSEEELVENEDDITDFEIGDNIDEKLGQIKETVNELNIKTEDLINSVKNNNGENPPYLNSEIIYINKELNTEKNKLKKIKESILKSVNSNESKSEVSLDSGNEKDTDTSAEEEQIKEINLQIKNFEQQNKRSNEKLSKLKEKLDISVLSPINGVIDEINDVSENKTSPFIVIEDETLSIKASTNEKDLPKLRIEQEVEILVLSTNKKVYGKIQLIGDKPIDNVEGDTSQSKNLSNYEVILSINSESDILEGYHVQGTIKLTEKGFKISRNAIFHDNNKNYIFIISESGINKNEVKYDDFDEDNVTVYEGISEGDEIILNPNGFIKDGSLVE